MKRVLYKHGLLSSKDVGDAFDALLVYAGACSM